KRELAKGRAPSTAAGEFVREEMHHVRGRRHGARSPKQAIAVGLAKARRAGIPLGARKLGRQSKKRFRQRSVTTQQVKDGESQERPRVAGDARSKRHSEARDTRRQVSRPWRGKRAKPRGGGLHPNAPGRREWH